jgi:hypothetical protein
MAKNGGFSRGKSAIFPCFGGGTSQHNQLAWTLLCRPTFLAPESEKNGGRHFSGEVFVDVKDTIEGQAKSPRRREKFAQSSESAMVQCPCISYNNYIPHFY